MAEQMIPEGAAVVHFAPSFTDLQDAIEAIDRAIKDESHLPSSGAAAAPDSGAARGAGNITEGANENVVDVGFELSLSDRACRRDDY